jgi:hypothetical protein
MAPDPRPNVDHVRKPALAEQRHERAYERLRHLPALSLVGGRLATIPVQVRRRQELGGRVFGHRSDGISLDSRGLNWPAAPQGLRCAVRTQPRQAE